MLGRIGGEVRLTIGRRLSQIAAGAAVGSLAAMASKTPGFAYNRGQAANYADNYWQNYNPFFDTIPGDDCTNFVSQAIEASGSFPEPGADDPAGNRYNPDAWYMQSHGYYSNTWAVTTPSNGLSLDEFLNNHGWATPVASYSPKQNGSAPAYPGGIMQADVFFYAFGNSGSVGVKSHASIKATAGTDQYGYTGDLIDAHTNNLYHTFWTLKPVNGDWQYTTTYEYHING